MGQRDPEILGLALTSNLLLGIYIYIAGIQVEDRGALLFPPSGMIATAGVFDHKSFLSRQSLHQLDVVERSLKQVRLLPELAHAQERLGLLCFLGTGGCWSVVACVARVSKFPGPVPTFEYARRHIRTSWRSPWLASR